MTPADTAGVKLLTLEDGLDYALRPVDAGYITFDRLLDGSIGLYHLSVMNDYLNIKAENTVRIRSRR